jgi:hypothetical protein
MGWLPVNPEKSHIPRSRTDREFVIALYEYINGFLSVCSGSKPLHRIGYKILSDTIRCNNTGQKDQEKSVNGRQLRTVRLIGQRVTKIA